MASEKMKCQFCTLDFTSVYKIIPHVYFGHRKKISRYVRDHQEVRLKCPAGCDFSHGVQVDKAAGPEIIFPILSKVFLELEDHMVNFHTKEQKLTMCPYCQKSLADLVYWEHLEEHMGSNATPTTPTPRTPGTPTSPVKSASSPNDGSPILKTPVKQEVSSRAKQEVSPVKEEVSYVRLEEASSANQEVSDTDAKYGNHSLKNDKDDPDVVKQENIEVKQEIFTAEKETTRAEQESPKIKESELSTFTAVKSPNKGEPVKSQKLEVNWIGNASRTEEPTDSSEEVMGFLEPVIVENLPPRVEQIIPNKLSTSPKQVATSFKQLVASPKQVATSPKQVLSSPKQVLTSPKQVLTSPKLDATSPKQVSPKASVPKLSKQDEEIFNQLKEIEKKIALKRKEDDRRKALQVKDTKQVDVLSVGESISAAEDVDMKRSTTSNEVDLTVNKDTALDDLENISSSNTSLETNINNEESKSEAAKSAFKAKVSEQRKAEIKRELAEIERKIREKKEEEKRQALLKESGPVISIENVPTVEDNAEVDENKDVNKKNVDMWEERRKEEQVTQTGGSSEVNRKEEIKRTNISGGVEQVSRSRQSSGDKVRSREVSGEQEISRVVRSRNTSGDKRNTKSVWSRETSGEPGVEESGRRSASQESRDSSQDKVRDSTSQERRDSTSRRLSGGEPPVKQKPVLTEEMERKIIYGGFKKKESREDKLNAVKREIETRFKEEETRKLKLQEEKRKAEEKEREKQRLNDEKLKKERERLREEKRKLKEAEKSSKENEEVLAMLEDKDPEPSVNETTEEPSEDASMETSIENTPKSSPPRSREKSPDQYQKIKMEIMKIDIEIEKKQAALHTDKRKKDASRSPSPTEMSSNPKVARPSSPILPRKVPGVHQLPKVEKPLPSQPEPEEDMDDLEMMMRDFQEREAKERLSEITSTQPVDSLSQLRDSYAPKARSISPSPPPSETKPTIPSGFDQDGHPLPLAPLSNLGQDPVLVKAANNAARGIMGPARSKLQSHSLQLQCSVCKEEGPSASYFSAYQLLSHVFLAHRKKIVSRSRKARGMTLACPEGCGFTTTSSSQGVSIDFFNIQLPLHLASLCEHIISSHTGEDRMDTCQFCSLQLDHEQGWSWQHLANHRDARRVYCNSCNNFPFKNEEHKCGGLPEQGLNSPGPFNRNTPSPGGVLSNSSTPKSEKTTKSLEELAREVESGVIKPEELSKQRHLGSVSLWVCSVCDQSSTSLSSWLSHIRTHLPTGQVRLPNHLKCFCCQWRPVRFERGSEVVALQQLVSHLLAEHSNPAWSDQAFEGEKLKLEQMVKDHEKRVQREKEEKGILVPKLPCKCTNCKEIISESKTWKYHVLAHKFGEVFCSTCMTCVLGHQFSDHKEACTRAKKGVAKARVEKYRGDTWLDVGGKKLKVFFEYDESEDLGRVTIAKCMVKGNLPMMGVGVNHEEAANVLKEEVEDYFSTLKEQEDTVNKEQGSQEDKQALIDMFVELVKIDQENAIDYFLTVGGVETPVNTRMEFTKLGKVQIVAIVQMKGEVVTEIGNTRKEAVNNLAEKISQMESEKENKKSSKFCCVDCGSRFSREVAFKLHQNIKCRL
eukprot:TRINITY_DN35017_c0_g1_i1.p1 TRINITY_DN35017_c0_g1~~TRINITY_DN35017_c0_g1_i1.p1  ORF type:complete len:1597 (+),score=610.53 TRINITY_DN35017_c0_g1_i1:88-4878(+)